MVDLYIAWSLITVFALALIGVATVFDWLIRFYLDRPRADLSAYPWRPMTNGERLELWAQRWASVVSGGPRTSQEVQTVSKPFRKGFERDDYTLEHTIEKNGTGVRKNDR